MAERQRWICLDEKLGLGAKPGLELRQWDAVLQGVLKGTSRTLRQKPAHSVGFILLGEK